MNIRVFEKDGIRGYHLGDIEAYLKEERPAFQLDEYILLGCPHKLDYNDTMMHEDSVIKLMGWTHKEHGLLMSLAIKEWIRSFKRGKRAYSTTHRIEIAYKSKYRCNMCDMILPPTFECDHIVDSVNVVGIAVQFNTPCFDEVTSMFITTAVYHRRD